VVVQWSALPTGPGGGAASARSLRDLGGAAAGLTLVAGLAALFFFMRYRLTRSRHAEILQGLTELRELRSGREA
jgi:Na+/melibiose symporter-like transporter